MSEIHADTCFDWTCFDFLFKEFSCNLLLEIIIYCSNDIIEFFPPNSRTLCPFFLQIAQMGLIKSRWGLILPRTLPPTPVPYSTITHPGICTYTKHPQPHPQKPLFQAWTWKWAKWTTIWATWTPIGQNVRKVDKTFLEVCQKNLFIVVTNLPYDLIESCAKQQIYYRLSNNLFEKRVSA